MKIVYCIAGTYNSGGMERVLANKANYLSKMGHDISIITTDQRNQPSFFEINKSIRQFDLGINYEVNNGKSFLNKILNYPYKQYLHKKRLSKLLHQLKPDITISMFCNDISFITDIKDGSRKVLEIHFSKFKRLQYQRTGIWAIADKWRTRQDETLVKRFDKFVVLTEEDKSYWGDLGNITVIPNALSYIPSQTADLDSKKVLAIGRFTPQKGFDILIDIWKLVNEKIADWQLHIIGDGELKATLQKQIENYHLDDSVRLLPPTKEIEKHYLDASVLVLTSRYEGLPMILLEAQSYGLPIVSVKCKCGPQDVVTEGKNGFLINEGDNSNFADKLVKLLQDTTLRKAMGQAAKEASCQYEESAIMQKWIKLFETLMQK